MMAMIWLSMVLIRVPIFNFGFNENEAQQRLSNPSDVVHGQYSTIHGVPQGPNFGFVFIEHQSLQYY